MPDARARMYSREDSQQVQVKAKPRMSHPSLYAAAGASFLFAALLWRSAAVFAMGPPVRVAASISVAANAPATAQESEGEESEVAPEQVEKYIAVYKAMQHNHGLTIDQAAAQQGLSVAEFRDIEGKIERDDLIRERVRQALRNKSDTGSGSPPASTGAKPH
jgi:hypothetical protein